LPRGRPAKSKVRQNLIEILHFTGKNYGYDLYKVYTSIFPRVTMRLIYYHLQKGVSLGEIKSNKTVKEKGNYSWGDEVEKTYYELTENARPIGNMQVKDALEKIRNIQKESISKMPGNIKEE